MNPTLENRLVEIVQASPRLLHVLGVVRQLGLPDWRVFSGAVYQTVWNSLTGRDPDHGLKDYDVGYFDPDVSWEAEDVHIRRAAAAFEPPLASQVEVRNQARVHLWFEKHFGEPFSPLQHTDEAFSRFVSPAFAVGVRLEPDDRISVAAPFGLEDVFALRVRPNPLRPLARDWDRIIAKVQARWPEVAVIQP